MTLTEDSFNSAVIGRTIVEVETEGLTLDGKAVSLTALILDDGNRIYIGGEPAMVEPVPVMEDVS